MKSVKYVIKCFIPRILYPLFIKLSYERKLGKNCNLNCPKTYTEKVQWAKINRTNELLTKLTDKVEVREWVGSLIGQEFLIPVIGRVYENVEDIDFDALPDRFVIKANHGSGFNILVNDKSNIDLENIKKQISEWLRTNYAFINMEMQYKKIKPRIFIEENILSENADDLPDYKFFCFNGKVFCSYTMIDYVNDHSEGRLGFFDRDYNILPYHRKDYKPINEQLPKPTNYWLMVEIAEKLSRGFSHVRVDLYNINGKIYFGEMTFSNAGGFCIFEPDEFDTILGNQWDINSGI